MMSEGSNLDYLEEVFHDALALAEPERSRVLDERLGVDSAARRELEEMLRIHAQASGVLDSATMATLGGAGRSTLSLLGRSVGEFQIVRAIGSGGMGSVYEAMQSQPRRRVAVKVMNPWLVDPEHLRRFEFEAEVLGSLEHPGIARIYGAGVADFDGWRTPYFAMEFIEGRTILDHAAALPLAARVELLARLCDAVEYAHRRGVVHRDLKPGNIIVASTPAQDESGGVVRGAIPKVLDFGIAKVVSGPRDPGAPNGQHTRTGQVVGTLRYMSPEQVRGESQSVDTRTDVYALGVIGYEVLAGKPPYEVPAGDVASAARIIELHEPVPLGQVERRLRGDLETIIGKALAKEPQRRYDSAGEMAADLRRHLALQPISATPPSKGYLLSRFARRNRVAVVAGSAVVLALSAGLVLALAGLQEARRQRDAVTAAQNRTKDALEESDSTVKFLSDMLSAVRPGPGRGRDVTVRQILDESAGKIGAGFAQRPEAQARLRETVGNSYRALGLGEPSETQLLEAYRLRKESLGENDPATLRTRGSLAAAIRLRGRLSEAETVAKEVLNAQRKILGDEQKDTLWTVNLLSVLQFEQGHPAAAEAMLAEWLPIRERVSGSDARETISMRNNLGRAFDLQGKAEQAHGVYLTNLQIAEKAYGEKEEVTLTALNAVGISTQQLGRTGEAEVIMRRARDLRSEVLGPNHIDTLRSWQGVAYFLAEQQKYDEAIREYEALLEARLNALGAAHPDTMFTMSLLGDVLMKTGRWVEAEAAHRRAYEARVAALGAEHMDTLYSLFMVGRSLQRQEKPREAAEIMQRLYEIRLRISGPLKDDTILADSVLSECLVAQGLYEDAASRSLNRWEVLQQLRTSGKRSTADMIAPAEFVRDCYASWARAAPDSPAGEQASRWTRISDELRRELDKGGGPSELRK